MWCNYNIGVWIKKNIGISFELILNTFLLANKFWKKRSYLRLCLVPKNLEGKYKGNKIEMKIKWKEKV